MKAKEIRAQARESLSGRWGKYILLNFLFALCIIPFFLFFLVPKVGIALFFILTIPLVYGYSYNSMRLRKKLTDSTIEFVSLGYSNFLRAWKLVLCVMLKIIIPVILLLGVFVIGAGSIGVLQFFEHYTLARILKIVWFLLLLLVSIWLTFRLLSLSFVTNISIEHSNDSVKKCVDYGIKIMKGNRLKLIWLNLTFFGWTVLSILTLGIGAIWLTPYISMAKTCFYLNIKENIKYD